MKADRHLLIKIFMILFLAAYLCLLCLSDSTRNLPIEQLASALEAGGNTAALEKQNKAGLKRFYQLEESDTDGYLFYKAASPMAVDEVFVVKARSREDAGHFLELAEEHLRSQKRTFEGYGTTQMGLLNQAVVESKGIYTWYFCGEYADTLRQQLLARI
ncbi:MAG: DUF4358 domain-containing protein [Blautia sp.]|nr:DUF4358 domain-containing protein [Blautia sp.]MDY5032551.1 DUF4358 domain-containing protein [Blautia sp.]